MRRAGWAVRPSYLAAQMRLDLSMISRHVRALEQQGLVERTADPDDARAQRISLTDRGSDVLIRVLGHRAATIGEAIAHWPHRDRGALHQMLRRLADDLSKVTEP